MESTLVNAVSRTAPVSTRATWAGWIVGGIAVLFLLVDSLMKILGTAVAVEATTGLGYPAGVVVTIGIVQLACLVLYVIPRTAILGAILLTGYLGGAIATHVRAGSPLLGQTLFPLYVAAFIWGALFLTDRRTRVLVEPRS
jgi:hypothetical protein